MIQLSSLEDARSVRCLGIRYYFLWVEMKAPVERVEW